MIENETNFLDVAKLLSGEAHEIVFDRIFEGPFEENGLSFSSIRFSGTVTQVSGFLSITAVASAELSAPCARCLAPVKRAFSAEADLPVMAPNDETGEDFVAIEEERIDLFQTAVSTLLPNLPFRLLCREDCKGLCPVCGKDLNEGDCGCDRRGVDPRLEGLAAFFENTDDHH